MLKVFSTDKKESVAEETPKEVTETASEKSEPQASEPEQGEEPEKVE